MKSEFDRTKNEMNAESKGMQMLTEEDLSAVSGGKECFNLSETDNIFTGINTEIGDNSK